MGAWLKGMKSELVFCSVWERGARCFIFSAGIVMLITSYAKVITAIGSDQILHEADPIFKLHYRSLLLIIGGLEFIIGLLALFERKWGWSAIAIVWIASCFGIYRVGLSWVGWHKPCSCLGTITDTIHLSPNTVEWILRAVIAYLALGSLFALSWIWCQGKGPGNPDVRDLARFF